MSDKGLIIVLSGFSGAGKGTIMKHVMASGDYHLSISATTRAPRAGEQNGREYFFKTKDEFEAMIENGELLEWANFNGNYYGTPKAFVEQLASEGKDVILEIEIKGALQVKKIFPEAVLLFVTTPDAATLKERLVGRGTETPEVVAQRLAISHGESTHMNDYDYIIVNDDIDSAVSQVKDIIKCEHLRISRCQSIVNKIQEDLIQFERS